MSPELIVQTAIRSRLIERSYVTDLVPAGNIVDRHEWPPFNPSIVIGEDQLVDENALVSRRMSRIYSTLHVWKKEPSLVGVKIIAGAVRVAIASGRLSIDAPFHCVDSFVSSARYMRDPDGVTAHGVLTVETLIEEVG